MEKSFWTFIFLSLIILCVIFPQDQHGQENILLSKANVETGQYKSNNLKDEKFDSLIVSPNRDYAYWLNFGVGGGCYGTTFYTGLSYVKKKLWFSIRYYFANEQQNEYDFENLKIPSKSCHEIGLLTGIMLRNKNVAIGIASGIAYLSAVDRGNFIDEVYYEKINYSGISFPIEAKFRLSINGVVGGGFSVTSNINNHKTYFGVILEITFGLL